MEMAISRRHPVGKLTLSVVLYICVSRVWCSYTSPGQPSKDLRESSLVSTTDGCPGSCDTITEEMCGSFRVCSLACRSGSRTTFLSPTVLTGNTECYDSQPGSLPAGVKGANGNYFTNSSDSTTCNVNKTVNPGTGSTRPFSISFWIQGSCRDCTVLRVDSLTVKLTPNRLLVNSQEVTRAVTDTDFVHVVLTKRSSAMFNVYVNNTATSVPPVTPDIQSSTLVLGPATALTGSESLLLLDGRFYNDGLTEREIEELFTGTFPSVSLESECRCPVSQPNISADGLTCSGGSGSSIRRLTKTFHGIDVVLKNTASSKWVSKATGFVTIMIDLQNSFQVTDVTVTFSSNGSSPTATEWSFESQGQKSRVDTSQYTLTANSCRIKSGTPPNYQAFNKTIAEKIEMKITGRSESGTVPNLIISSITISGKCDCDGAATACTLRAGSNASYTCACLHQTEGDHCRSCVNGYYREETGFGCTESCDCDPVGRNPTRICETVGGKCLCKSNVEGARCDTCKPLTYNITVSNPDGCTRSSCDTRGSSSSNNETGECYCRTNVINSNCSECKEKHYWTAQTGCLPCACNTEGTTERSGLICAVQTGLCDCKPNVEGRQCGQCKDEYYGLSMTNTNGCSACQCHAQGTTNRTCNKGSSGQCHCRGDDFTNRTCTPSVTQVVPLFGPVIGGTVVTISGHYLINSTVTIGTIGLLATKSDTQLTVTIPAQGAAASETLSVTWPPSSLNYPFQFTYKPNPTLAAENPTSATAAQSGGCYITLAGVNLNSVYKPRMMVNASGDAMYSDCKPESSGKSMKCATPAVVGLNGSVAPVYVLFDSYINHQQLNLTLVRDAGINTGLFLEFAPPFEKTITIKGERIGTDCHRHDYRVVIGDDVDCSITSFSETSIECEPPSSQPVTTSVDKRKYKIRVFVGAREVEVGEIYYKQFWLTNYFVYIMVGCGLFIIALIALLICICVCRRRRTRKKQMNEPLKNINPLTENNGRTVSDEHELIEPARPYTPFPRINKYTNPGFDGTDAEEHDKDEVVNTEYFLHRLEEGIRSKVQACVIGKKNFTVGSVCFAKGNHARLVDGTFTARSKIEPMEKLTIKMLKDPLPESGVLSSLYTTALRECLRFRSYEDESLLTIKGIGLDKRRFYILYPYMENRTLKDHILDSKKNFVLRQLLELSGQVCEGMDFLSTKDVVHKDLATRNCMLDAAGRVKITDASFSWDFYPHEYMYDNQRDRYLPVRWMAPESLSTGFYDSKSDVWSFGVLMWELMTRGLLPFQDIADEKVQDAIVEGFRLGKPQMLTEDLYELMNSCWHAESEHRPSFVRIQQEISSAMTDRPSMNESLYVNQESINNVYVNSDEIQQIRNSMNK